jgi:hypothetical protein
MSTGAGAIQGRLLSEPDLDVTGLHWPSRGFFRTGDRFADNLWQQPTQATQDLLAQLLVVRHLDQRHATSFPKERAPCRWRRSDTKKA